MSMDSVKIETDRKKGLSYAAILSKLKSNINRPIAAILILNTIANTGGATFAGSAFAEIYGSEWMWLYSSIFTCMVLFGTEILPKVIGVTFSDTIGRLLAKPLAVVLKVLHPILVVTELYTKMITGKRKKKATYSLDDLQTVVEAAQIENIIDPHQEKIIVQTSRLKKRNVEEIMLPIKDVIFLPQSIQHDDYFEIARKYLHTRYPVSKTESVNDLVGYLNLKEIALSMEEVRSTGLKKFVRPLLYIPKSMSLTALLKVFSSRHNHLAIVRDERGNNIGMITLEDIVEEVVGEIQDEFDTPVGSGQNS